MPLPDCYNRYDQHAVWDYLLLNVCSQENLSRLQGDIDPAKHLRTTACTSVSKIDQIQAGIDPFVSYTHNSSMIRCLSKQEQDLLFWWSDGSLLTRPRSMNKVKA